MGKQTKIWVLFSIENDYDQPTANLEAWWFKKPSIRQITTAMNYADERSWYGILKGGDEVRIGNTDYRLEEVEEGRYIG